MHKLGPQSVERRSFERGANGWHYSPILLIGSDRIIGDVELLLEDRWKDLRHAPTPEGADELLQSWIPRIVIAGIADQNSSSQFLHLLETKLKSIPVRTMLLSHEMDEAACRQLDRRAVLSKIYCLRADQDAHQLAKGLDEILTAFFESGLTQIDPLAQRLLIARAGYIAGLSRSGIEWDPEKSEVLVGVSRFLLGRFRLTLEAAEAADILAQIFDMWPQGPDTETWWDKETEVAYLHVKQAACTSDVPVQGLVKLAAQVRDLLLQESFISQNDWNDAIQLLEAGPITKRKLKTDYEALKNYCVELLDAVRRQGGTNFRAS